MKQRIGLAIASLSLSLLSGLVTSCRTTPDNQSGVVNDPPQPTPSQTEPTPVAVTPAPDAPAPVDAEALYQEGLAQAATAADLSQRAQSRDDWGLAVTLWEEAIEAMASVPPEATNHAEAQSKVAEYQRNLAVAQERANRPITAPSPRRITTASPAAEPRPEATAASPQTAVATVPATPPANDSIVVPILRRSGGTPVVNATFNGSQSFPMILDTGASGTVITQPMAMALGVVPNGQAVVNTASQRNVTFLLGNVRSIEVGAARAQGLRVAIAGPNLSIGLLGQDFFRNYDVTIRENTVEFHPR